MCVWGGHAVAVDLCNLVWFSPTLTIVWPVPQLRHPSQYPSHRLLEAGAHVTVENFDQLLNMLGGG